jgi:hypothetical protein
MMPPNGDQADPQQEIQFLNGLLQDSQLIVGQQQVTMLRMRQQLEMQEQELQQYRDRDGTRLATPEDLGSLKEVN